MAADWALAVAARSSRRSGESGVVTQWQNIWGGSDTVAQYWGVGVRLWQNNWGGGWMAWLGLGQGGGRVVVGEVEKRDAGAGYGRKGEPERASTVRGGRGLRRSPDRFGGE